MLRPELLEDIKALVAPSDLSHDEVRQRLEDVQAWAKAEIVARDKERVNGPMFLSARRPQATVFPRRMDAMAAINRFDEANPDAGCSGYDLVPNLLDKPDVNLFVQAHVGDKLMWLAGVDA